MSSESRIPINRPLVGILALVCFGAAGIILLTQPRDESWRMWLAGFVRVGLLLSALWIALPSRHREAAWASVSKQTFIGILIALIALLRLRLMIVLPIAVAVGLIALVLRPRSKEKARPNKRTKSREQTGSAAGNE